MEELEPLAKASLFWLADDSCQPLDARELLKNLGTIKI
jgi:hypothetical protein